VIELVGPAGVGKTTVSLQLEATGQALRGTMWFVPTRLLARSTLLHLPAVLALFSQTGSWLWDEIKHLARLEALHAFLGASRWNGTRLVVLDEGPVYTLSWLQVIGRAHFRQRPPGPWWARTIRRWAGSLDAVVVLDAPDAVLADRIRTRAKPHMMKDRSLDEVSAFATAYRVATERVLVDLMAAGGPPVLRFDLGDDENGLDERVLSALGQSLHAH
jgi:RecA/RadA recombinase